MKESHLSPANKARLAYLKTNFRRLFTVNLWVSTLSIILIAHLLLSVVGLYYYPELLRINLTGLFIALILKQKYDKRIKGILPNYKRTY